MPFELPADLHPDCAPIAWLLGTWRGNGRGEVAEGDPFAFAQECVFAHDGRPFFHYLSRTWEDLEADGDDLDGSAPAPDGRAGGAGRNLAIETGFLRCGTDGALELLLAHNTGYVEVWYGAADGAKIELTTDAVVRTITAKEYTGGTRLYGLVEGDLLWAFDMAAMGRPLRSHVWGRLVRQ